MSDRSEARELAVGLTGGHWEYAGPYIGSGTEIEDAAAESMARCAGDYADQAVMFMTIASTHYLESYAPGNLLHIDR